MFFYKDEVTAVIVDTTGSRKVSIGLRPICDRVGLDWSAQLQRLRHNPILSEEMSGAALFQTATRHRHAGSGLFDCCATAVAPKSLPLAL